MLKRCAACGGRLLRVQRTFQESFVYQAIFRCKECGKRRTERQWYLFLLGGVSTCPRCGTHKLKRLTSIDKIDSMYTNPFSYLQKYFGANLHHCGFCRLQFYDYRKREADIVHRIATTSSWGGPPGPRRTPWSGPVPSPPPQPPDTASSGD